MTKDEITGHWHKCEECGKIIPIPDFIFTGKNFLQDFCPFCNTLQLFQLSSAKKPCTKKEALLRFKIEKQLKDRIIRFETYWESEKKGKK